MRTLKLCHGPGNGLDKACLMTASNMLMGRGHWLDENPCVCELIRHFVIPSNDRTPEDVLGELYGPLAWEILGTRNPDINILRKRAKKCLELTLELYPLKQKYVLYPLISPERRVAQANRSLRTGELTDVTLQCGIVLSEGGHYEQCVRVIREMAAIGDTRPVEPNLSDLEIKEMLGGRV